MRDVAPGEAVLIDQSGNLYARQCAEAPSLNPCIFEFVYLARPDSIIDGASVYETRLAMGEKLADKIPRQYRHLDIDVVIPIPDSSRPAAMQLALGLGLPYREGYIKNPTLVFTPSIGSPPQALAANLTGSIEWACGSATTTTATGRGMIVNAGSINARYVPNECK